MKFSLITFLLSISLFVYGQSTTIPASELQKIAGQWTGTLTYTDYKDDVTTYTLKCAMATTWNGNKGSLKIGFTEPNGSMVYDKTSIKRLKKGQMIKFDGLKYAVEQYTESADAWQLIMSCKAKDNNRNSDIKQTIDLRKTSLSIRKEVRYDGSEDFFVRNVYVFERE